MQVITDDTFSRHEGFDLATFDDKNWPPSELPSFRVLKTETYKTFKSRVAQHFHYPESQIRLWVLVNRQNKTVRPDTPIPENEPTLSEFSMKHLWSFELNETAVEVIRNNMAARQSDLRLYLDVIPEHNRVRMRLETLETSSHTHVQAEIPPQSIMVFLKHFDTSKQSLTGAGKVYMLKTNKVGDLVQVINERMRWTPGTPIKLYEEIKPGMIELMKPKMSFAQSEIQDGDVICFQVDLPENECVFSILQSHLDSIFVGCTILRRRASSQLR